MTDNATPKPCPFCGFPDTFINDVRRQFFVECCRPECGARGPRVFWREMKAHNRTWAEAEALRRWNERAGEEAQL